MSASDETRRIIELLRHHHGKNNEWATFIELRGSTGFINAQAIDFFAVHTWPSKNFRAIAYEIKVSRSDFTKELKQPNKRAFAESIANECLFVVPSGLLRVDEIPEGWGLMVADAGGLKTLKHGTQRSNVTWPKSFTLSLARRAADPPSPLPLAAWKCEGREIGEEELIAVAEHTLKTRLDKEQDKLRDEGKQSLMEGIQYRRMVELQAAVAKIVGRTYADYTNANDLAEWLLKTGSSGSAQIDLTKIARAQALLDEAMQGAKP